jgi:hypothetical protein
MSSKPYDVYPVIIAIFFYVIGICLAATIWAAFGGVSAWCASIFFGPQILRFLAKLGIEGFSMFEIGSILGFFASFLNPLSHEKETNK